MHEFLWKVWEQLLSTRRHANSYVTHSIPSIPSRHLDSFPCYLFASLSICTEEWGANEWELAFRYGRNTICLRTFTLGSFKATYWSKTTLIIAEIVDNEAQLSRPLGIRRLLKSWFLPSLSLSYYDVTKQVRGRPQSNTSFPSFPDNQGLSGPVFTELIRTCMLMTLLVRPRALNQSTAIHMSGFSLVLSVPMDRFFPASPVFK